MPRPEPLDCEALIAPIPGDNPAGKPLPDAVRMKLDEDRKEVDPHDPTTANRKVNWPAVKTLAKDTLTNTSKDLLVAVRLVEALAKKDEFPGVRDGMKLLRLLVENCWDRLYPENGEDEARAGRIKWLNDSLSGARYPFIIQSIPLLRGRGEAFSYFDWLDPVRKVAFEEALATTDSNALKVSNQALKEAWEDLNAALEEVQGLANALDSKLSKDDSPDLQSGDNPSNIGAALRSCIDVAEELLRRRGINLKPVAAAASESAGEVEEGSSNVAATSIIPKSNREGLYRQLEQIADALQALEPHSPIPYLVKRAVRLGSLPFPELMRAIIRETGTLDELDRLLGLEHKSE